MGGHLPAWNMATGGPEICNLESPRMCVKYVSFKSHCLLLGRNYIRVY